MSNPSMVNDNEFIINTGLYKFILIVYIFFFLIFCLDPDYDMFCKGVFKRGDKCLVHFYRMPESHDNWGQMWPPEDKEPPEGNFYLYFFWKKSKNLEFKQQILI